MGQFKIGCILPLKSVRETRNNKPLNGLKNMFEKIKVELLYNQQLLAIEQWGSGRSIIAIPCGCIRLEASINL